MTLTSVIRIGGLPLFYKRWGDASRYAGNALDVVAGNSSESPYYYGQAHPPAHMEGRQWPYAGVGNKTALGMGLVQVLEHPTR